LQKLDQSKIIEEVGLIDSEQANIRELTAPEVQEEDAKIASDTPVPDGGERGR
jgi:DNA recombination protein RmuC